MPDKDSATPRLYLLRHGQTSWSQSGRYTGKTDIPLLPIGESQIRSTASHIFGPGKLIDPSNLARVYVSPRQRARRTLELLWEGVDGNATGDVDVSVTEDIAEWGYGDYEGLLTSEIRSLRKDRGLDTERPWDIWIDGCEGSTGESPSQIASRVDKLINEITAWQGAYLQEAKEGRLDETERKRDILVVAHGHVLRCFVKRWLGFEMGTHVEMMLEPGGVCGLSYAHGRVEERAVLVGMSFPGGAVVGRYGIEEKRRRYEQGRTTGLRCRVSSLLSPKLSRAEKKPVNR